MEYNGNVSMPLADYEKMRSEYKKTICERIFWADKYKKLEAENEQLMSKVFYAIKEFTQSGKYATKQDIEILDAIGYKEDDLKGEFRWVFSKN